MLPSNNEAFGIVLLEAMANSRVIVGSDSGAIPEIVHHGENGLLFAPGDSVPFLPVRGADEGH